MNTRWNEGEREMDRKIIAAVVVVVVLIAAIVVLGTSYTGNAQDVPSAGSGSQQAPSAAAAVTVTTAPAIASNTSVQEFRLSYRKGQYVPAEIRVAQGTMVRIVGDMNTLTGCMSNLNIEGYISKKHLTTNDNVVEFTADKVGTFAMHCNMGMGNGTFVVEKNESYRMPGAANHTGAHCGACAGY
jgi:hypothetical protein